MASYQIEWKRSALKELKKTPKETVIRIVQAIELLAFDPFPTGTRKLSGAESSYRIRVGDYRVIYSVHEEQLLIEIVRVGHRKDVYRR